MERWVYYISNTNFLQKSHIANQYEGEVELPWCMVVENYSLKRDVNELIIKYIHT